MEKRELVQGDVVQLNPETQEDWGGKLMIVTEPKSWGAQGYVLEHPEGACTYKGRAYRRVSWEHMEYVGHLHWIFEYEDSEDSEDSEDFVKIELKE